MVAFNINKLLCISTGLTATAGDGINCDHAEEIRSNIQANTENVDCLEMSLKKTDQAKTLVR